MNITVSELLALKNPNIIDIRDNAQYNMGHIKGAKNIAGVLLLNNPSKHLNKNDTYYIYCNYGSTSSSLCMTLKSRGYKVFSVLGGYNTYKSIK